MFFLMVAIVCNFSMFLLRYILKYVNIHMFFNECIINLGK